MTTLNVKNIREELVFYLRNADVLSVSIRGVTTGSYSGTGSGAQTTINLGQTNVRNVRSLTIDAVAQKYLRDYTVNFSTGVVTLTSALSGGEALEASFDYGSSEKIYPDFPRDDLTLTSFPRVGIEITSATTEPFALGGADHISDFVITIFAIVPVNKDSNVASGYGGTGDLSTLVSNIRGAIRTYAKSLHTIPYIYPLTLNPITTGWKNKAIMQSADFMAKFIVE